MKFDIKKMKDKPIKIKTKGVNVSMVFSVIIIFIVLIATLTSKMWLPDDRDIKNLNNEESMTFNNKKLDFGKFYIDNEKEMGEISFKTIQDIRSKDDLSFAFKIDGMIDYPNDAFKVIKGSILPTTDENKFFQEYLIQFTTPIDFYYIDFLVTQDTIKTQSFQMDYRNFVNKSLDEKGDNFLISLDDLNIKIVQSENIVNKLNDEIKGYASSIDSLKSEITALETKMKVIDDEKTIKEKQATLDEFNKSLVDNESKLKSKQDELAKEQKKLEDLQNEKESKK